MSNDDRELVTSQGAATILHRDRKTVQRWAAAGRLPYAAKVPGPRGAWLFDRDDVEALAEQLADAKEAS